VDFDCFEPTNLNRQLLAASKTIGKSKTSVFAAHAKTINPKIKIRKINKKLEYASFAIFERELAALHPGIVIDTMDNIGARVLLARLCKKMRVPYVYAAATDARGMVSIVQGAADLERLLRLPSAEKPDAQVESFLIHYPQCRSAWGPGTNLVGVLAANAALNYLLKKPYPRAPKCWMVDAFAAKIVREEKL
jgi:molybdopterin/thiamine biosynthesis adenylyltransferase